METPELFLPGLAWNLYPSNLSLVHIWDAGVCHLTQLLVEKGVSGTFFPGLALN
jgi:hypothetical protein